MKSFNIFRMTGTLTVKFSTKRRLLAPENLLAEIDKSKLEIFWSKLIMKALKRSKVWTFFDFFNFEKLPGVYTFWKFLKMYFAGDPLAKPPSFGFEASEDEMIDSGSSIDVLLDVFRNLIPNNIIGAAMWQDKTQITRKNVTRSTADNQTITVVEEKRDLRRIQGANILGLIFYAALVAMALRKMSNTGRILIRIIFGLNELIMNILYLFMWFVPLGVCSLVASTISEVQDVMRTASMIGSYTLTVLIGLALQFQVYIILYLLICRKNPATFFFKQARANMISFGTSSTAAALPANMQCAIENNKINRQVSNYDGKD